MSFTWGDEVPLMKWTLFRHNWKRGETSCLRQKIFQERKYIKKKKKKINRVYSRDVENNVDITYYLHASSYCIAQYVRYFYYIFFHYATMLHMPRFYM